MAGPQGEVREVRMDTPYKDGQKVWAAIAYGPRFVRGKLVTYRGTRDGRFLQVEDEDGHGHLVARHHVVATREALVKKFPGLETDAKPAPQP
jgi:hypothetical protein